MPQAKSILSSNRSGSRRQKNILGAAAMDLTLWTKDPAGMALTATTITEDSGTGSHQIYFDAGKLLLTTYEVGIAIKDVGHAYHWFCLQVTDYSGFAVGTYFNIAGAQLGAYIGSPVARGFNLRPDGFYYVYVRFVNASANDIYINFLGAQSNSDVTYTGNGALCWEVFKTVLMKK